MSMLKKEILRLKELDAKASKCEHFTSEELHEWTELEFKRNKENIYFRLSGNEKYYYANQCYDFTNYILKNGYPNLRLSAEDIERVSFDNHAITLNRGSHDIKRFNNKHELLGFVIGYNEAIGELNTQYA